MDSNIPPRHLSLRDTAYRGVRDGCLYRGAVALRCNIRSCETRQDFPAGKGTTLVVYNAFPLRRYSGNARHSVVEYRSVVYRGGADNDNSLACPLSPAENNLHNSLLVVARTHHFTPIYRIEGEKEPFGQMWEN